MLCHAGSCGRAAALHVCVDKRPVAGACSRACAEQIRAQLIGMPKRTADDDDYVDDDRRAFDRIREERQRQKQRFLDFATLGEISVVLSKIRADVYALTPLEVSTATMRIGDRFDDDGTTMAARLDALLRLIVNMQATLLAGGDYDVDQVLAQVRAFRDAIAEDTTRAKFEQAMTILDASGSYRRLPDDIQRLMAYRANPVQKLADFSIVSPGRRQIWAHNGRIRVDDTEYAYDGTLMGRSPYEYAPGAIDGIAYNSLGQAIVALEPRGSWAMTLQPTLSPLDLQFMSAITNGYVKVYSDDQISHSSAPNKLFQLSITNPKKHRINTLQLVSANNTTIGTVAQMTAADKKRVLAFFRLSIDTANATITNVGAIYDTDTMFKREAIALDSGGNVWIARRDSKVLIFNAGNQQIAQLDNIIVSSMCVAEDGVWITYMDSAGAHRCANYRLAPAAVYNRGLASV